MASIISKNKPAVIFMGFPGGTVQDNHKMSFPLSAFNIFSSPLVLFISCLLR